MGKFLVRLSVALLTFLVGVCAAALLRCGAVLPAARAPEAMRENVKTTAEPFTIFDSPTHCTFRIPETAEQKAVRLAEEFVARNGYTDLPGDRNNLSYESIEWESDAEEMLKQRHDSLERKAYGIYYAGRGREKGWTVVFRPGSRYGYGKPIVGYKTVEWGRAVTMNKNFERLRVEHKGFPLGNVHKKF